jgi:hypothetical protein
MAFQQHLESLRRYNPTKEFEYSECYFCGLQRTNETDFQ